MTRHRFERSIRNRRAVFIIALHVTPYEEQWRRDIDIARDQGADGIIVIRDYTTAATDDDALRVYTYARDRYPHWWIGLNLLSHRPLEAVLRVKTGISSLWFDEVYVDESKQDGAKYFADVAHRSDIAHLEHPPILIPSVAMKYQPQPKSMARVAQMLEPYADLIVTSGEKTGEPPSIEKMSELRAAVKTPIGIVSGASVDNVKAFMDVGVNAFIVWSSIAEKVDMAGQTIEWLNPEKVGALRSVIPRR